MPKHKWKFKSYFRREAYSWNGTAKASKRMKEAVSEIKKVAKKDSALAGEGTVELFIRLYPALMHIDSSSGALGTAMNKTIDTLIPILIKADWDMNTRGKWLDILYTAIFSNPVNTSIGLKGCKSFLRPFFALPLPSLRFAFACSLYLSSKFRARTILS